MPDTKAITVRLPLKDYETLQLLAEVLDTSMQQLAQEAINLAVKGHLASPNHRKALKERAKRTLEIIDELGG